MLAAALTVARSLDASEHCDARCYVRGMRCAPRHSNGSSCVHARERPRTRPGVGAGCGAGGCGAERGAGSAERGPDVEHGREIRQRRIAWPFTDLIANSRPTRPATSASDELSGRSRISSPIRERSEPCTPASTPRDPISSSSPSHAGCQSGCTVASGPGVFACRCVYTGLAQEAPCDRRYPLRRHRTCCHRERFPTACSTEWTVVTGRVPALPD